MTTIRLKENEPVEVALRRFRREIERTGLIKELRARTAYEEALLRSRDCSGSTNWVLPLAA
jgi:ribosomal protein S21